MISENQSKYFSALKEKKYRDREQKFLIEGLRLCEEVFESDYEMEKLLYCPSLISSARLQQCIAQCFERDIPAEEIDEKILKKISDTVHSQGILGLVKKKKVSFEQLLRSDPENLIALENVNDPGNLGTILRSASWFGMEGVLLSQNSVDYTNPKVVRSSMGAIFHLPIFDQLNLTEKLWELKKLGYSLFLTDAQGDVSYSNMKITQKNIFIFGNETEGVSESIRQITTSIIKIPRKGKGDSLNVAVAAGIIFAEISRSA